MFSIQAGRRDTGDTAEYLPSSFEVPSRARKVRPLHCLALTEVASSQESLCFVQPHTKDVIQMWAPPIEDGRTHFYNSCYSCKNKPFAPQKKNDFNIFEEIFLARIILHGLLCIFEYIIHTLKISSSVKDYTIKCNSHLFLVA